MSFKEESRNAEGVEIQTDHDMEQDGVSALDHNKEPTRCDRCQDSLTRCLRPVLHEYHPLPNDPSQCQRFRNSLYCPPHGRIGAFLFVLLAGFIWWGVLWSIVDKEALPGGNLFSLFLLFVFCWCGGYLISLIHLPPLLGMLIVGGILGNVPGIDIARNINQEWSAGCRAEWVTVGFRQIALAIILICAGLGLDPAALRRLSFVVVRLAFSPCIAETIADAIGAHLILGFPWQWGFMLGFVISAVSPAVVVPSLLSLSERGYGVEKGVPTLVMAASSIDDVLAITGFGVLIGITFSSGDLAWNLLKGPIEAVVGILIGIVMGIILWYVPQQNSKHLVFFRSVMVVGLSLLAIFGSSKVEWSGTGPLAALTLAFVAALRWRKESKEGENNPVEDVMGALWMIFQPLLFGLIAAAVEINKLKADTVGLGIAVLGIGLVVRSCVAFLAVFGTNLTVKEKVFIPFAWLPKATVQAAIGAVAYDMATTNKEEEYIGFGENILQLAVLSILLTAPTGAAIIAVLGPILLHRNTGADRLRKAGEHSVDDPEANTPLQEARNDCGAGVEDPAEEAGATRSASFGSVDQRKRNKTGHETEKQSTDEDSRV